MWVFCLLNITKLPPENSKYQTPQAASPTPPQILLASCNLSGTLKHKLQIQREDQETSDHPPQR